MHHVSEFRVRYSETDQMGVVYHANYLVWCEIGRTELMRATGNSYAELEREGIALAVVDASLRFMRPARYDNMIRVTTTVDEVRTRVVRFTYAIDDLDAGSGTCDGRDDPGRDERRGQELRHSVVVAGGARTRTAPHEAAHARRRGRRCVCNRVSRSRRVPIRHARRARVTRRSCRMADSRATDSAFTRARSPIAMFASGELPRRDW